MPNQKVYKPEDVQQYILATHFEGETKIKAFKEHIDSSLTDGGSRQAIARLETSDQYTAILEMANKHSQISVNKSMADAIGKYYNRYGDLLDEGQKAIEEAKTLKDKKEAMQEQRSNMMMPVISNVQKISRETKEIDTEGVII